MSTTHGCRSPAPCENQRRSEDVPAAWSRCLQVALGSRSGLGQEEAAGRRAGLYIDTGLEALLHYFISFSHSVLRVIAVLILQQLA